LRKSARSTSITAQARPISTISIVATMRQAEKPRDARARDRKLAGSQLPGELRLK
jgi:hypothetical protein